MKYYLIAGEASGDIYGAKLIQALSEEDIDAEFRYWGGDEMKNHSPNIAMHYEQTAFMGFWEVIKNLPKIRKLFSYCKRDILKFKPDVVICIDYPGFNLRMVKWAKKNGFRTVFYIAPQLWAWKKSRYKIIRDYVDQLFVILPFEKGFYKGLGVKAYYYGHPLANDIVKQDKSPEGSNSNIIALLPGSRQQELNKHIPILLDLCNKRPQDKFVMALAPHTKNFISSHIDFDKYPNLSLEINKTREVLSQAHLAVVSSGTATLETALVGVPQIVIYRTSAISFAIGKRLVNLPWISLVNIIGGKEIVKELLQHECTANNISQHLDELLSPELYSKTTVDYTLLREGLEIKDSVSHVAEKIFGG